MRARVAINSVDAIGLAIIVIAEMIVYHVTAAPLSGVILAGAAVWLAFLSARDWWAYQHATAISRWDRKTEILRSCARVDSWMATVWGLLRRYERAAHAIERSDSHIAVATRRDGSAHNPRHGGDGVDIVEES